MNRRLLALGLLLAITLCGCWDQRILERVEYILNAGVDARPGGRILLTLTTPFLQGAPNSKPKPVIYETVAYTPREGRERLRLESVGRLEAGKLEQIFFGEELARRGIHEYLEILKRDPFNPTTARVVVVKGTAQDLLEKATKWQNLPLPGLYFKRLLDDAATVGDVPQTTVDRFYVEYFAPGLDPILPMIAATPKRARLLGSALFREDRLAGELSVDETFLILALKKRANVHIQDFPIPKNLSGKHGKKKMTLRFIGAKVNRRLSMLEAIPIVAYELKLTGVLEEFQMDYPASDRDLQTIERHVGRLIEEKLAGIWRKLRAVGADPLGVGNMVRAHHNRYWRQHDWRQVYPAVEARFRVKVDLQNPGAVR